MSALLVFSIALIAAILLSALLDRSILSTAVPFLFAGFLAGPTVLNLIPMIRMARWFASAAKTEAGDVATS